MPRTRRATAIRHTPATPTEVTGTLPPEAAPRPAAQRLNTPPDGGTWDRVVREVADDLAVDALARDRAGKPPHDEAGRLREAGLPALLTPPATGTGADWRTACAALREIAAADGSLGELLARHYVLSWSPRLLGTPESARNVERRALDGRWLWAGDVTLPDADRAPETDPGLTLTPAGDGYVLDGQKSFAAGVTVADRLLIGAPDSRTGEPVVVTVDPGHPAVTAAPAHDRLGQRLTGAGTVRFDGVPIARHDVVATVPREEHDVPPCATLAPLALRLALVHVGLGIAEGALAEARDVIRRGAPPAWTAFEPDGGGYETRPDSDPYLLLHYGELVTAAHAAASVAEPATRALAGGLLAGQGLGVEERAEIAVLVAAAEAVTHRSALHVTTRLLELTEGAAASADDPGLDRFWRNARVLTAREASPRRFRDIGDHYLNGAQLPLTLRG
ncbi:acyl-CoA dehydrogenase family protein [Streptomyces sp. NPDC050161]|uniref:acyl-CoA dehydrogenase family protein n=1 Tax=Streptomyces sp. NPDC050161 TaxID=3365604 RepID=UPI00379FF7D3